MRAQQIMENLVQACQDGDINLVTDILKNEQYLVCCKGKVMEAFICTCTIGNVAICDILYNTPQFDIYKNDALAFTIACNNNDQTMIDWLMTKLNRNCHIEAFAAIYMSRDLDAIRNMHDKYSHLFQGDIFNVYAIICDCIELDTIDMMIGQYHRQFSERDYIIKIFMVSCEKASLQVIQHIYETFKDTIRDRGYVRQAFHVACKNNSIEVAKWLNATFDRVTRSKYFVKGFVMACRYNSMTVAKWLSSTFGVDNSNPKIVEWAYRNNNLEMISLLSKDVSRPEHILIKLCADGNVEMIELLISHYPSIDIHHENDRAFRTASIKPYDEIMRTLAKYVTYDSVKYWICSGYAVLICDQTLSVDTGYQPWRSIGTYDAEHHTYHIYVTFHFYGVSIIIRILKSLDTWYANQRHANKKSARAIV